MIKEAEGWNNLIRIDTRADAGYILREMHGAGCGLTSGSRTARRSVHPVHLLSFSNVGGTGRCSTLFRASTDLGYKRYMYRNVAYGTSDSDSFNFVAR